MITAVTNPQQAAEFGRRIAQKPYFDAAMGTSLALFGGKPGSGWLFYLLPGNAALAARGGTANICGTLPDDAGESMGELADFLQFLGIDCAICEQMPPAGWREEKILHRFTLPAHTRLCLPPAPELAQGLTLARTPRLGPVAALLFPEDKEEREQFYSNACTAIAHGYGRCLALQRRDGAVVSTVGCYAVSAAEAYLSAGETAEAWRGQGLGGWLIATMANEQADAGRDATFLCEKNRCRFYQRLGFTPSGYYIQYCIKGTTND